MVKATTTSKEITEDIRYLNLLAQNFPTIADASTEIINLEAILNLPKPTEHFIADPHGEYEAFKHVLKNASGNIKRKVNELFGNSIRESEKKELCTLIYYPAKKLELVKIEDPNINDWYLTTLNMLVKVCQNVSSKYTRSKVRKSLPDEFSYIIEELLHESLEEKNKHDYVNVIISTIVKTGRADDFIIAMCRLIQRLAIDKLHLVGDIYDRGPGAHIIMDVLCKYHNFDIQWGNHDIGWIGAAAGNDCNIFNVLRLSLRYANLATLEDGYGINLLPLATFALDAYKDDDCKVFYPKVSQEDTHDEKTRQLIAKMHKAASIIQFKLEAKLIDRHPEWKMDDRKLLHHIDFERGVITIAGKEYEMKDSFFPTIDPANPYELTEEEKDVVNRIHHSFRVSEKLKQHVRCMFHHGAMFTICNSNLLFHASIPMNADGTFKDVFVEDKRYHGKALLEKIDQLVRSAFNNDTDIEQKQYDIDYMYYLWCGKDSPLFDKEKMTTFERYFVSDKELYKEEKGAYYALRNKEEIVDMILDEFGVKGKHRHIINGHVPVKAGSGECPVKANGKLLVIDGGFSKAYQPETGIAGYTLVYHSRGLELVQHQPFTSTEDAIKSGTDIRSTRQIVEMNSHRMMVRDTDKGAELIEQINELYKLLHAYRNGFIKEKIK